MSYINNVSKDILSFAKEITAKYIMLFYGCKGDIFSHHVEHFPVYVVCPKKFEKCFQKYNKTIHSVKDKENNKYLNNKYFVYLSMRVLFYKMSRSFLKRL